ncbi:hypothetical protein GCM10028777_09740 [Angustibacter speluncae]
MTAPARGLLVAVAGAALLAACVGPAGPGVRTIDPADVPYDLLSTEPPPEASTRSTEADVPGTSVAAAVYLQGPDDELRAVPVDIDPGTPLQQARQVLTRLQDGPTATDVDEGLTSALGPDLALEVGRVDDGVAEVDVSGSTTLPAADLIPVAIGQIVLSLTGIEGVDAVRLVRDGRTLPLPLPGGRLTTDPVTTGDYLQLTVP